MSISLENFLELDPVLAALNEATGEIQEEGLGRWSFSVGQEEAMKVTARVDQEWVLMDALLPACEGARGLHGKHPWKLLRANLALSGGAKFVLGGNPRSIRLRAEIRVMDEIDLAGRIRNACLGFQGALPYFRRKKSGPSADRPEPLRRTDPGQSHERLQALCTEAGWASSGHHDGGIAVRLEVPESYYQAALRRGDRGSLDVWVELAREEESWPRDSWKALGIFLFQACGHLKTVRAGARDLDSGTTTAGFQVALEATAGSEEVGLAFRALSVACSLVGKEVKVMHEEVVGKEYLAMVRGRSSKSARQIPTRGPIRGE